MKRNSNSAHGSLDSQMGNPGSPGCSRVVPCLLCGFQLEVIENVGEIKGGGKPGRLASSFPLSGKFRPAWRRVASRSCVGLPT